MLVRDEAKTFNGTRLSKAYTPVHELPYLKQLLWARHVFINLLYLELTLRYQRSFLGFLWSALEPLITMCIYWAVFTTIFRVDMNAYIIYLISALFPFMFASNAIQASTSSLLNAELYCTRHYIPKITFPLVCVAVALFDFFCGYLVLFTIGHFAGFNFGAVQLMLPFSFIILIVFTIGAASISAVLGAYFDDARTIIKFMMQVLFFITPILYSPAMIPESVKIIVQLNPFSYLVDNFTLPLYYHQVVPLEELALTVTIALATFGAGVLLLKKAESSLMFRV
jgi:ABC-type polysaccharide/polyol phosphate export permease